MHLKRQIARPQILLFVLSSVTLWNCGGNGSPSYEATKMTLEEQEKSSPTSFLTVEGKTWENLIGQTVIEGDIKSSATIARFKDVVLIVTFFTKTDTHLGSETYVIYEFVNPGQLTHFKIKMDAPSATEKIAIDIESAKTVD